MSFTALVIKQLSALHPISYFAGIQMFFVLHEKYAYRV